MIQNIYLYHFTLRAKERATLSAEEVFGMPCPIQRRHNFLNGH